MAATVVPYAQFLENRLRRQLLLTPESDTVNGPGPATVHPIVAEPRPASPAGGTAPESQAQ